MGASAGYSDVSSLVPTSGRVRPHPSPQTRRGLGYVLMLLEAGYGAERMDNGGVLINSRVADDEDMRKLSSDLYE